MTSSFSADEERVADLAEMIETGLGHPVSFQIVRQLAERQAGFETRQMVLAEQAMANRISREAYVTELDILMQGLAAEGESLLGFEDFHKVFGEFRVHNLFDPQAFIAEGHATR